MTRSLPSFVTALLLAGATAAFAQTPPADAPKAKPRAHAERDCSKAADPKACEERRAKMRAAFAEANKACEGKQGAERRECMSKALCAKSKDPAKCEARAKERAERKGKGPDARKGRQAAMQEARKACEGKQGAERRECMTKSMCAKSPDPAKCEAQAKERAAKRAAAKPQPDAPKDAKK